MRKRIIFSYIFSVCGSLFLGLIISGVLVGRFYEEGKISLQAALAAAFSVAIIAGARAALLLGRHISKNYSMTISQISDKAKRLLQNTETKQDRDPDPDPDEELYLLDDRFRQLVKQSDEVNFALRSSMGQLETVLLNLDEGIISVNENGDADLLTKRCTGYLGENKTDEKKLRFMGINYALLEQKIEERSGEDFPLHFEAKIKFPLEFVLRISVVGLQKQKKFTGEIKNLLIVIQDITRIRKLEEVRRDFVANITHELKTPLTSILGYIELLESADRDKETRNYFYHVIETEALRLKSLTSDLLKLSELEHSRMDAGPGIGQNGICSLKELWTELNKKFRPSADEKNISLRTDFRGPVLFPGAKEDAMTIFGNLISNAIMYNRPGGFVELSTDVKNGKLIYSVSDNGIGIAKADRERIFERFYRVHKERSRELGGTGLGLSIVKHCSQMLGGEISLESRQGEGSSFRLSFPETILEAAKAANKVKKQSEKS